MINKDLLGNACDIIAGQSPPSQFYNSNGIGLPFFQGKADFGELHPKVRVWCSKPNKIAEPGDILISVRAPVGPTNLADRRCCIGRGLAAIRPHDNVHTRYLLHYLRHLEPKLSQTGRGSTFAAITVTELRAIEIPLPPLPEQRRIAAILDAADGLRAKRRAALGKLDALLQSVFLEVEASAINNQQTVLSDVIQQAQSGFASGMHDDQGIAQIRMNNVNTDGHLVFDSIRRVPLNTVAAIERFILQEGDVIFNSTNSANLVGKSALFKKQKEPFVFSNHFLRLVSNPNRLDSRYLAHWLAEQQRRGTFEMLCTKWVNQAAVRREDLLNMKITLPSPENQKFYGDVRDFIDSQRELFKECLCVLDKLFFSLQHCAFGGEL